MYGNNISDKKKYLLAYKERLLGDINFYDKEIADFRNNKVISKEEYYDSSDSEDEAVYKPIKVTQSLNDVVKIKERLDLCLLTTQELSNLTVLESGIMVLNEEPKLKQYPLEPGIWKEVLAECRVDSVPISIRFSVHQPYRRFAQSTFHELQVLPVKEIQEKELKDSVLHTSKTPCEAVEVIRNYAAASRSRKTTLAKLAEYFADSISMEPTDEGGIIMKCGEAIEIYWTLENRVSTVTPFQNKFKLTVNEINPSYIGELKEAYKQLRYPDLDTDERTLALATIIKMCLDSVPENKPEDEMLVDEVNDDNTSKGNKENMSAENQNNKKGSGKNKSFKNNQNILKENTNVINKEGKKQISGTNKNPKDKTVNNNKIQNNHTKKSKENVNSKENVDTVKDKLDEVPIVNNIHNIEYNCIEKPCNNKEVLKNKNKQAVNNDKNTKVKSKQMQNNENCANNAMKNINSNDEVVNNDENVKQTNAKKCTNEKSSKENEVKKKQKSRNTNKNSKDVGITDEPTKYDQNDENVISNENNVTKDTKDSEKRNKNEKNTENCNINPIYSEKILKKDKSNQKTKEMTKTKSNKKVETAKDVAIENAKEINVLNKQNILKRKMDAANEHEVKKLKSSKNHEHTAADKVISKSYKEIVSKETVVDINLVDLDKNNTDACKNKKINVMAHEREKNNHIEAKEKKLEMNNKSKAVNTKPNVKSVTSTSKGNVENCNTEHEIVKSKVEIKINKITNKPINTGNTGDNKKINTINRENLKSGNTVNQLSDKTNVKSLNCKEINKKSAINANKIVNNKFFNNNKGTKNIHQNIINKNFSSKFKPSTGNIQNSGTSKIPQKMSPSIQRKMKNMLRRSPRNSASVVRKKENHHSSIPRIIKPVQAK